MFKFQRIKSSMLKVQRINSSKDKKFNVQISKFKGKEGFVGLEKFVVSV